MAELRLGRRGSRDFGGRRNSNSNSNSNSERSNDSNDSGEYKQVSGGHGRGRRGFIRATKIVVPSPPPGFAPKS